MEGRVIESTGSFYKVKTEDNKNFICKIKGNIKLKYTNITNPISIGDLVKFEGENLSNPIIIDILPRKNFISRKSPYSDYKNQIIAANIDQAVLVTIPFITSPNLYFLDKFLITTEFFKIVPLIVFNKIDLLNKKQFEDLIKTEALYNKIGYKTLKISILKQENLQFLIQELKNKINLLTGNSGVGKSTIINTLIPGSSQKTSQISKKTLKGKRTTSSSKMFNFDDNTYIIDSPGVKYLFPNKIEKSTISNYFPEMQKYKCKYYNCNHIHEPDCEIKKALEKGTIAQSRYKSYKKLMEEF